MLPVKVFGRLIKEDHSVRSILDRIYGIGHKKAESICSSLLLYPQCKISEVPKEKVDELNNILESMKVGPKLKISEIKKKKEILDIKTVRALMLQAGLPVNGQRYGANARTAKKLNKRWMNYKLKETIDEKELFLKSFNKKE